MKYLKKEDRGYQREGEENEYKRKDEGDEEEEEEENIYLLKFLCLF